jgi:hypothetical protein
MKLFSLSGRAFGDAPNQADLGIIRIEGVQIDKYYTIAAKYAAKLNTSLPWCFGAHLHFQILFKIKAETLKPRG